MKNTAIIVLGMHRSGTSALAGALSILGAHLPKNLMEANDDNKKGFFESVPIMHLNDRILQSYGSKWDCWKELEVDERNPAGKAAVKRIQKVIESEFSGQSLLLIKDPRVCRIVPLWTAALDEMGYGVKFILPIRNPLEVAASLNKRNGISATKGQLLWLRHVLDAERYTRSLPRKFLLWDDVCQNWRREILSVGNELSIKWPNWTKRTEKKVDDFITPDMVNHHFQMNYDNNENSRHLIYQAYNSFKNITKYADKKQEIELLEDISLVFRNSTSLLLQSMGEFDAILNKTHSLSRELQNLERENIALKKSLDKALNIVGNPQKVLEEIQNTVSSLESIEPILKEILYKNGSSVKNIKKSLASISKLV
ncbi:hypothetical protein PQU92_17965 [Asticcacaulis sp. BYS171W]|uniref:Sulfotransferase family protein n=1 Tax=Asticcacaulis aquaticus TaxID=2984212 RepID=A0ABT5HYP3_9CAUL|nr:hypothetical protein [Asticcacaulis aquaticus]MDC7685174.1 hypothetical protein [Asticcacaulis aquaticus]